MSERAHEDAIKQMLDSPSNYENTRWAAFQNKAMDSANLGHLQFLAVGPKNTCKEAPEKYPADTSSGMGWRYRFIGYVNLETGEIEEEKDAS